MRLVLPLVLVALAAPSLAYAQEAGAPTACAKVDADLPAAFAGWARPGALSAAADPAGSVAATLAVGQASQADLRPTPSVQYPLRPEKPGGSVSYGGLFGVQIDKAGTYVVALSSAAWIDVTREGVAVDSVDHGHGPACTSIRKMVAFPLQPGRYVIQVSANGEPQMTIMVTARP